MSISLSKTVLFQYYRFTLYNSPYVAHDSGCAIDLYPDGETAPSPVSGEVLETRKVKAPQKSYAETHDYLILVDTGTHIARILHVEPGVSAGEYVESGDSLGRLVRAGFFAPWVPNHIHLGFREYERNPYRAAGSIPITVGVAIQPLEWDGQGTVVETGETWARLDSPSNPHPGEQFVGLESDGGVLDGGFPHYDSGGLLAGGRQAVVAGTEIGLVSGRNVSWDDVVVEANGQEITGLALFVARDEFGVKLVGSDVDFESGDDVSVSVVTDT